MSAMGWGRAKRFDLNLCYFLSALPVGIQEARKGYCYKLSCHNNAKGIAVKAGEKVAEGKDRAVNNEDLTL